MANDDTASNIADFSHPAPIPARQARSREATRKVVAAFQTLLKDKSYDLISMNEVACEAGVSVGTIYTRFPSKDHLLLYLVEATFFSQVSFIVDEIEDMAHQSGSDLPHLIKVAFTKIADLYTRTRHFFAPLSLVLRMTRDETLLEPASKYNRDFHERLAKALSYKSEVIAHKDPEAAARRVLLWGMSALREMILYEEPVSDLKPASRQNEIDELCVALTLYLTASLNSNGTRS